VKEDEKNIKLHTELKARTGQYNSDIAKSKQRNQDSSRKKEVQSLSTRLPLEPQKLLFVLILANKYKVLLQRTSNSAEIMKEFFHE